jgi:hypothetical protein
MKSHFPNGETAILHVLELFLNITFRDTTGTATQNET